MIREQSGRIGSYINDSLLKLGVTRRYFGELPYPDPFGHPRLEVGLSFYTEDERDLVFRNFSEALKDWIGELRLIRVDDFAVFRAGDFRHHLSLLVSSPSISTTECAYAVMVRAAEQIRLHVCKDA